MRDIEDDGEGGFITSHPAAERPSIVPRWLSWLTGNR